MQQGDNKKVLAKNHPELNSAIEDYIAEKRLVIDDVINNVGKVTQSIGGHEDVLSQTHPEMQLSIQPFFVDSQEYEQAAEQKRFNILKQNYNLEVNKLTKTFADSFADQPQEMVRMKGIFAGFIDAAEKLRNATIDMAGNYPDTLKTINDKVNEAIAQAKIAKSEINVWSGKLKDGKWDVDQTPQELVNSILDDAENALKKILGQSFDKVALVAASRNLTPANFRTPS